VSKVKYGILLDNQLIYAKEYFVCEDGNIIINFNSNEKLMMTYGFKVVIDEVPTYDLENEYVIISGYTEKENVIIINYEIREIVKTQQQLRADDQLKCLKMFAETLSDEQALKVPLIFDEFEAGKGYEVGKRILYQDVLYKVITSHTSQETWTPDVSPSLFAPIINETIDGSIPEWKQPDSTNAYMIGDRVIFEDKEYESLVDNNVWSPSANPSGWQLIEEEVEEPETPIEPEIPVEPEPETPVEPEEPEEPEVETVPEWVQPDATTAYKKGDKVMFEGKIYESTIDGNVWSPTAYPQGWQEIV
jgi:hypothetical protein